MIYQTRTPRTKKGNYRPRQISFHASPPKAGWPDHAPYDLVVSLCPFGWLPNTWLRQCRPGAAIVQVLELEIPDRLAFLHVDVDDHQHPTPPRVLWQVNDDLRNSQYTYSLDANLTPASDEDGYDIAVARYSSLPPKPGAHGAPAPARPA